MSRVSRAVLYAEYMKAMQLATPPVTQSTAMQAPERTASVNWDSAMEAPLRAMKRAIAALRSLHDRTLCPAVSQKLHTITFLLSCHWHQSSFCQLAEPVRTRIRALVRSQPERGNLATGTGPRRDMWEARETSTKPLRRTV